MIYDTPITLMALPPDVGSLLQGNPVPIFSAYCAELTVYHTRFWESVQAGSRIDLMVEIPLRREVNAGMYASYQGHTYSVQQAQFETDENGLPITVLSLKREEDFYDPV